MTAVDLLNALKAYTEDKVKDMRLIARVPENGTDPGERPPLVFIGNLPNKEQEKKAAPYILLKLLTKKVDDEENVCRVRIICVTFSEDKNENYMQCLNLVTKIETSLLEDVVIDEHYSCQKPIETIIYDENMELYQVGELMTIWEDKFKYQMQQRQSEQQHKPKRSLCGNALYRQFKGYGKGKCKLFRRCGA